MIEKESQRDRHWLPEDPPLLVEEPPDQDTASWKLAWVVVGMLTFFAIMYALELLW